MYITLNKLTLITTLFTYLLYIFALKMPVKSPRYDQFYDAFESFIAEHFVLSGKLDIWNLTLLTKNTRKNIHEYELSLPYNRISFSLDRQVTFANGTIQGPGSVYVPQTRPPLDEFRQEFCAYFSQFELVENGKSIAGVHFHSSSENDNQDIKIGLFVRYYKGYSPYPIELTREQELENLVQRLEDSTAIAERDRTIAVEQCDEMYYELKDTKIMFREYMERQTDKYNKLAEIFRKVAMNAYEKEDPKDCPVCLDPMTKDTVDITLCAHYICKSCNVKCSKCPLCRQSY